MIKINDLCVISIILTILDDLFKLKYHMSYDTASSYTFRITLIFNSSLSLQSILVFRKVRVTLGFC